MIDWGWSGTLQDSGPTDLELPIPVLWMFHVTCNVICVASVSFMNHWPHGIVKCPLYAYFKILLIVTLLYLSSFFRYLYILM